jgi:hypothetical protein
MAACFGPLATINCELRQAWKGATVTVTSGAEDRLGQVATLITVLRLQASGKGKGQKADPEISLALVFD